MSYYINWRRNNFRGTDDSRRTGNVRRDDAKRTDDV